jgi:hypothetical protein
MPGCPQVGRPTFAGGYGMLGGAGESQTGLPFLFWVLGDNVLEALLHPPSDALDQLQRGLVSERVGPPAGVSIATRTVYVVPPARGLSTGNTERQEFRADDPVDIALRGEDDRDLQHFGRFGFASANIDCRWAARLSAAGFPNWFGFRVEFTCASGGRFRPARSSTGTDRFARPSSGRTRISGRRRVSMSAAI